MKNSTDQLRRFPADLSDLDVKEMLMNKDFYDSRINPDAWGAHHRYDVTFIRGDRTVVDFQYGLMWHRDASDFKMSFDRAKSWLITFNHKKFAGYSDWDFPTLEEAMSLVESETSINSKRAYSDDESTFLDDKFKQTRPFIWTADSVAHEQKMWVVNFKQAFCTKAPRTAELFLRPVRRD